MATDWDVTSLESLCSVVCSGGTPRTSCREYYEGGSIPWVTTSEVNYGRIETTLQCITQEGLKNSAARLLPAGTVIVAMYGRGTAGRVAMAAVPLATNQACCNLQVNDSVADARFVYYSLWADFRKLDALANGSVQQNLSARTIRDFQIAVPGLPEQRAIAHILGTLDDKIELNRRMNETLEAMARALFKSWFIDFEPVRAKAEGRDTGLPEHIAELFPDRLVDSELGLLPEGWNVRSLGLLTFKPQYGYTASANDRPVGPKFLRITDINKTPWIDWSTVPYCAATDEQLDKYRLRKGDVLIARMADPGHGVLVEDDEEAVFASYLIRFRPKQECYQRYLQYWLRSEAYWDLVKGRGAGTTRVSLNARVMADFPLVVPSERVAGAFSRQADALRQRLVTLVKEAQVLGAIRDALLPRLISGDLRVKDPKRFIADVA